MRINHNIQALNAYRNLSKNQNAISKHMERLSSGLRINHASDDAAGLAISEKMRTQIRGLEQAERNTMDGISLVQTAEGALDSVHSMLQRMRELAVQAANDTATENDRLAIQDEINQLTSEINRIGNSIEFNSRKLLDGSISSTNFSGTGRLQGGANAIVGVKASGSLTLGTTPNEFTIVARSAVDGTELNGYKIVFGVDSDVEGKVKETTVTISDSGNDYTLTITPTATTDPMLAGVTINFVDDPSAPVSAEVNGNTITIKADLNDANALDDIEEFLKDNYGVQFAFTGTADLLDGESIILQHSNVKASISGRTITVTGDWDGSNNGQPADLDEIAQAINTALKSEGLGEIELILQSGTLDIEELVNAGEISLLGGIKGVSAKNATQILSVNARPNEKDVLVINDVRIGFWDSSKTTFADAATAKAELGVAVIIDIYDGMKYKESYEITSEIAALNTQSVFADVTVIQSDAGSDLIITAKNPGVDGNNIRTDFIPTTESGLNLQIGANTGQRLVVDIPNIRAQSLKISGITAGGQVLSADGKTFAYLTQVKTVNNGLNADLIEYAIDVSTHEKASAAITIFEDALNRVSSARSKLGAYQNRLEYTSNNLAQTAENVTAAESRIRDADMALEMTNFTKNNIINQAAQAMLAQANQLPQGILQLLK